MTKYPSFPSDSDLHVALELYWSREATPEQVALLDTWFERNPGQKRFYTELKAGIQSDAWVQLSPSAKARRKGAILEAVQGKMEDRVESQTHHTNRSSRFTQRLSYLTMALVIGVMVVGLGWASRTRNVNNTISTHPSTYATGTGERASIVLSDGSVVLLSVASRLEVPLDYAAGNRTVHLNGEALFNVTHHEGAPFTVVAGRSTTRVLGTSFAVRYYATDTAATVAVREGRVAIGSDVLTAGQAISVNDFGATSRYNATVRRFAFARGVMELEYRVFPDAIPELNRWYNADIRLGDTALLTQKIVGVFEAGSITDLISILELTFNVHVVRDGRILTLYQRS